MYLINVNQLERSCTINVNSRYKQTFVYILGMQI